MKTLRKQTAEGQKLLEWRRKVLSNLSVNCTQLQTQFAIGIWLTY